MMINQFLLGAIVAVAVGIALVMLRSWRATRDRFFLFFSAAFFLMGVVRLLLATVPRLTEHEPLIYLLNLLAMSLIVFAIVDKNRKLKQPGGR